jgi:hypothetical protein
MSIQNDTHTAALYVPVNSATAGNGDDLFCVNRLGGKAKVSAVDFIADGAVTANDSNNATFTCTVAGVSVGAMTTSTTGTGDIADGGVASITLSGAGSNLVAEGGAVKVAITKTGSGVAVAGTVAVTLERVRAD